MKSSTMDSILNFAQRRNLIRLAASVVLVFASLSAHAHTGLKESTPADGATVAAIPGSIELVFTGPVRLVKLELTMAGHAMPTNFKPGGDAVANYTIATPGMHPGDFTVNWAVIGADGHTVTNSFSFKVDPAANSAAD
ncbi:MAG: copper resistance protein CopC [Gammaproteobacteria bacterium]